MNLTKKTVGIIQARMSSLRLPGKVLMDVAGKPLLQRVIERSQLATVLDELWVATSNNKDDDEIEHLCKKIGIPCYRGSLDDVRSRFLAIAKITKAFFLVRITADNPLTEPLFIDLTVNALMLRPENHYAVMKKNLVPIGSGVESFSAEALITSSNIYFTSEDLEHVTLSIKKMYQSIELDPEENFHLENESVTVDTFDEYLKVKGIFSSYPTTKTILKDYIASKKKI